jgi:hypothetical protein
MKYIKKLKRTQKVLEIIKNNGDCGPILCKNCPLKCVPTFLISNKDFLKLAKQWLIHTHGKKETKELLMKL